MSTDTNNTSTSSTPTPNKKKLILVITTGIFILALVAYVLYWFFVLRYQEYTDDAYVAGLQVPVMAQTSGDVVQVFFEDTDLVNKGDIIVSLDDTNAKIALESAKHDLANAVRNVQVLYQENIAYKANIELEKVALSKAQRDYHRIAGLGSSGAVSQDRLQHALEAIESAKSSLAIAVQKLKSNEALLANTPPDKQPSILSAADTLRKAWVNLEYTKIKAPITGYVARRNVQVGSQVSPSTQLMSIVPVSPMWINANFKETQLNNIRIGQPVTITSALYGSDIVYHGTVTGLTMGTGAAFSLLPAQNATGNWIKIVQRLPVRINLDPQQLAKHPLRIGLSMNVTVDVKDQQGSTLELKQRGTPAFQSYATVPDLTEANEIIKQIIQENTLTTQTN